jgi:CrcB protein
MEIFPVSAELRTMLTIGFLGAFTTFSTFSYETVGLIRDGDWTRATLYTGLSVVLAVAAVFVGMGAASVLLKVRG